MILCFFHQTVFEMPGNEPTGTERFSGRTSSSSWSSCSIQDTWNDSGGEPKYQVPKSLTWPMLIWIPGCRLEWSQGYTESHSSVINTVWPHSQSLDQEKSSCGLGHSSWVYGILELVLGLIFTDIYLSYCLWLLNFNFQYFALEKYGFVVDNEVVKWNGIFSEVLGDIYLFCLILILSPLIYFIWFLFNQRPLIILISCSPPRPTVLWL